MPSPAAREMYVQAAMCVQCSAQPCMCVRECVCGVCVWIMTKQVCDCGTVLTCGHQIIHIVRSRFNKACLLQPHLPRFKHVTRLTVIHSSGFVNEWRVNTERDMHAQHTQALEHAARCVPFMVILLG
jgi:hypothetical protein